MHTFDLVILGGGPGGYRAALLAVKAGFSVALIEKRGWGGTCLHTGCIPSKSLLHQSQKISLPVSDLGALQKNKTQVIDKLARGLEFLLKQQGVHLIAGEGIVQDAGTVRVNHQTIHAQQAILLATGAVPFVPSFIKLSSRVMTSDTALSLGETPQELIVCGAGYIGLELGVYARRLGSRVTLIEASEKFLPFVDADLANTLKQSLKNLGIDLVFGERIDGLSEGDAGVCVTTAKRAFKASHVLVAMGRQPHIMMHNVTFLQNRTHGLQVNEKFETSVAGIYAIGDLIEGPMLAHRAEADAEAFVRILSGQPVCQYAHHIPSVIYTEPSLASVGFTEQELVRVGVPFKVGKAFYAANGRAQTSQETKGFLKILIHQQTKEILGIHCVGAQAETLIGIGCLALHKACTLQDLLEVSWPHPTFSELYKEAAFSIF